MGRGRQGGLWDAEPWLLLALLRAQRGRRMLHGPAAEAEESPRVSSRDALDGEIEALLVTLAVVSESQGQWDPSQAKGAQPGDAGCRSGVLLGGCWVVQWRCGRARGVQRSPGRSSDEAIEALDPTFPARDPAAEGEGVLQGPPWRRGPG